MEVLNKIFKEFGIEREIEKDIEERDYRDMHREYSPLCQAADAVYLDSSDLDVEDVTAKILEELKNKLKD